MMVVAAFGGIRPQLEHCFQEVLDGQRSSSTLRAR